MISTRGRYALRVLVDLAEQGTDDFVPLNEIAERQGIIRQISGDHPENTGPERLVEGTPRQRRRLQAHAQARGLYRRRDIGAD